MYHTSLIAIDSRVDPLRIWQIQGPGRIRIDHNMACSSMSYSFFYQVNNTIRDFPI